MRQALIAFACVFFWSCVATLPNEHTVGGLLGRTTIETIVQSESEALMVDLQSGDRKVHVAPGFTTALERMVAGMPVDRNTTSDDAIHALRTGLPLFRQDFANYVLEGAKDDQAVDVSVEVLASYVTSRRSQCNELPCPIPPCAITCGKHES